MCEKAESVQAFRQGQHAIHGQQTVGGLESGNAAIGGRPQHRPLCLLSDGDRNHPRCDRGCRTARAAAWRVFQIPRVARRAWRAICEGGGFCLSNQYRTTLAHLANDGGIFRANSSFINWRAVFSSQTPCLDNVFCAEGDSCQLAFLCWFLPPPLIPALSLHVALPILIYRFRARLQLVG